MITARELASVLRDYAVRSPERCVWRRTANLIGAERGASYSQVSRALRFSGLYPRRGREGFTAWCVDPVGWWVPTRDFGKTPARVRERCPACGRTTKIVAPVPR